MPAYDSRAMGYRVCWGAVATWSRMMTVSRAIDTRTVGRVWGTTW